MNESWILLILLALAASFLPLPFGFEVAQLGKINGIKKGFGYLLGFNLFRFVLVVGLGVVFTGLLEVISNFSADIKNSIQQFSQGISSGQYILFDGLLILAGIALWVQVYHHIRNRSKLDQSAKSDSSKKDQEKGAIGLIIFGFTWAALSPNQWLFMAAGLGQIFLLSREPMTQMLIFFLFLLIASLMLFLPFIFYIARPQNARKDLEKINTWLNEAMPYIVAVMLFGIGLYFIISGTMGVINFLASQ